LMGSMSHALHRKVEGYIDLPVWPDVNSDSALREDESSKVHSQSNNGSTSIHQNQWTGNHASDSGGSKMRQHGQTVLRPVQSRPSKPVNVKMDLDQFLEDSSEEDDEEEEESDDEDDETSSDEEEDEEEEDSGDGGEEDSNEKGK
jgi:cobalamin biosynthesis protein CobT